MTFGYLYIAGRLAVYDVTESAAEGASHFTAALSADPRMRAVAATAAVAEAMLIAQLRRWERSQLALPAGR